MGAQMWRGVQTLISWCSCLALLGCGMSEERFLTKLYASQCEYEFDCAPALAEAAYGDLDGCDEAYNDQIEDGLDYFEGCRLDAGQAKACLDTLGSLQCLEDPSDDPDLSDACDERDLWACDQD